jgi:hypothetical protein
MIAWPGGKAKKKKGKRLVWLCQQTPVETFVKIQKSTGLPQSQKSITLTRPRGLEK